MKDAQNGSYCRWKVSDGGASIAMDSSVVQRLKQKVFEGFHALPKRGAEVGGVLLGRIVPGEPFAVRIDDFEPVPCEYRFGPSFTLSNRDRAKLEEILARRQSDRELSVVGYYRSCTGRELALDTADEELIREYFSDPQHVFLSVKPLSSLECLACFFFWQDGQLTTKPVHAPFPFDAMERAGQRDAPVQERPEAAPAQDQPDEPKILEPVETPVSRQAMRERRPRRDGAREQRLWPSAVLLLTLVIGCAFAYQWWESGPPAQLSQLDLVAPPPPTQPAPVRPEPVAPAMPPQKAKLFVQELAETPEEQPPPSKNTVRPAVPAVTIHKVQPGIPEGIQARIQTTIMVAVQVEISASGEVTSAVPEGQGDGLYTYLAGRAALAARWWRFEPAKSKDGTPVASTKTIYFVFKS